MFDKTIVEYERVNHLMYWVKPALAWFTPATLMMRRVPRQVRHQNIANGKPLGPAHYAIEWHDLRKVKHAGN